MVYTWCAELVVRDKRRIIRGAVMCPLVTASWSFFASQYCCVCHSATARTDKVFVLTHLSRCVSTSPRKYQWDREKCHVGAFVDSLMPTSHRRLQYDPWPVS